jgi:hypothetical protein
VGESNLMEGLRTHQRGVRQCFPPERVLPCLEEGLIVMGHHEMVKEEVGWSVKEMVVE